MKKKVQKSKLRPGRDDRAARHDDQPVGDQKPERRVEVALLHARLVHQHAAVAHRGVPVEDDVLQNAVLPDSGDGKGGPPLSGRGGGMAAAAARRRPVAASARGPLPRQRRVSDKVVANKHHFLEPAARTDVAVVPHAAVDELAAAQHAALADERAGQRARPADAGGRGDAARRGRGRDERSAAAVERHGRAGRRQGQRHVDKVAEGQDVGPEPPVVVGPDVEARREGVGDDVLAEVDVVEVVVVVAVLLRVVWGGGGGEREGKKKR